MMKRLRQALPSLTRNAWVIIISWILFRFGTYLSMPYVPNYIRMLCGSEAAIGIAYALNSFFIALFTIPGGYIGDLYGRRRIVVYMTWGLILAQVLLISAISPAMVLLYFILDGILHVYIPALHAIFADSLPEDERARGFMLSEVLPNLIAIPAPLIGGLVIAWLGGVKGYRAALVVTLSLSLMAASLRHFMLEETLPTALKGAFGQIAKDAFKKSYTDIFKALRIIGREVKVAIVLVMVQGMIVSTCMNYMVRYAMLVGFDERVWGEMNTISSLVVVIMGLILSPIMDLFDRVALMSISALSMGVGLFMFARADYISMLAGLTILNLFLMTYRSAMLSYMTDKVEQPLRGRISAVRLFLMQISRALGNLVGAFIYPMMPMYTFIIASMALLALAPLYAVLKVVD
ncbi:MAG: hypothetical protein DRN15_08075 [Thermoprotei archaeon]|nr:MAG: hypothetical protein DRM97_08365 [Thermoprotei archaeon]RLF22790.1 MAG: hypothetical protein DRN15_08075 [Thermoprotei archaeon]